MNFFLLFLLFLISYILLKNKPNPKSFSTGRGGGGGGEKFLSLILSLGKSKNKEFYDCIIFWIVVVIQGGETQMWIGALGQWTPIPKGIVDFLLSLQSDAGGRIGRSSRSSSITTTTTEEKETQKAIKEKMAGNYEKAGNHYLQASKFSEHPLPLLNTAITAFKASIHKGGEPSSQYEEAVERCTNILLKEGKNTRAADIIIEMSLKYSSLSKIILNVERAIHIMEEEEGEVGDGNESYKLIKLKRETLPNLLVENGQFSKAFLLFEDALREEEKLDYRKEILARTWLKMVYCQIMLGKLNEIENNNLIMNSIEWKFIQSILKDDMSSAKRYYFLLKNCLPKFINNWFLNLSKEGEEKLIVL